MQNVRQSRFYEGTVSVRTPQPDSLQNDHLMPFSPLAIYVTLSLQELLPRFLQVNLHTLTLLPQLIRFLCDIRRTQNLILRVYNPLHRDQCAMHTALAKCAVERDDLRALCALNQGQGDELRYRVPREVRIGDQKSRFETWI